MQLLNTKAICSACGKASEDNVPHSYGAPEKPWISIVVPSRLDTLELFEQARKEQRQSEAG